MRGKWISRDWAGHYCGLQLLDVHSNKVRDRSESLGLPRSHCFSNGADTWSVSNFESIACKSSASRIVRWPCRKSPFNHQKKLLLTTPDEVSCIFSFSSSRLFGVSSRIKRIVLITNEAVNTAAIVRIDRIQKVRTRAMSRMMVTTRNVPINFDGFFEFRCSTNDKAASAKDSIKPRTGSAMAVFVEFCRHQRTSKAV